MVEALTRALYRLSLLVALLAVPSTVFAHRDDEYLQATLVTIEPNGILLQINLTPGIAVAEQVIARIDRDRDDVISADEASAYVESLTRDLTLRLDGRNVELNRTGSEFVSPEELRTGSGIIRIEFSTKLAALLSGTHKLTLENRHLTTISVYLINAAQPKLATIQITGQKRNDTQSVGEIEFTFHPLSRMFLRPLGRIEFAESSR